MKLSILSVWAFALALSGAAIAADQPQSQTHQPEAKQQPHNQPQAGQSDPSQTGQSDPSQTGQSAPSQTGQSDPSQTGRSDPSQTDQSGQPQAGQAGSTRDQDYQAELRKCANASDTQKCVDQVKNRFGQM